MKVLVAPAPYRGTLTAREAAEAIAEGWADAAPGDTTTLLPLSDGGEGFVAALAGLPGSRSALCTARGPLGGEVPAEILLVGEGEATTAYVEAAQVCGPALVDPADRDPVRISSYAVGQVIREALTTGARRVVVGVRDVLCHDGGLGMWRALAGLPADSEPDPRREADVLPRLAQVARSLVDAELVVATPDDLPLLGLQGTSATQAEDRGASPAQAQELERRLGDLVERVGQAVPAPTDLLTGRSRRLDKVPGAGAGGGLGYGLLVLGGSIRSGAALVAEALGLRDAVSSHDLVATGEGTLDWTSLRGRVVAEVGAVGLDAVRPVVVIPGQSLVGRRETAAIGLAGIYPVADSLRALPGALADPAGTLRVRAARVARTWSRA